MEQLSLDDVLNMTKEILWKKDEDSPSIRRYMFALDENIAQRVVDMLTIELQKSKHYKLRKKIKDSGDIEKGIEFNYCRYPAGRDGNFLKQLVSRAASSIGLNDFDYFASVYFLKKTSKRVTKIEGKKFYGIWAGVRDVNPPQDIRVLMIEGIYTGDKKDPFVDLIRTFYSVYQTLKTPSKT